MFQHICIFAVAIPDHQEIILQINLVDIFQVGVSLDIGAAVGGDDGHTGRFSFIIVYLGVIFVQQQRQAAFVLAAFDNKNKIYIHQVVGAVSQVIENHADIGMFTDSGIAIFIQNHLTNLTAVEIRQQIWGMSGKNHLIFAG